MGRFLKSAFPAFLAILLLVPVFTAAQKSQESKTKKKSAVRDILSFDGGILFETDGRLSDRTCFRVKGSVTAPQFFDDFKRIDDAHGTVYRRGQEILTEFPEELHVSFVVRDLPCPSQMQHLGPRRYLTREMMGTLHLSFYWKRGIELRRIEDFKEQSRTATPVAPYNTESTEELPKRYEWSYEITIPSAGVPLTDRLVLMIRTQDGRTAARVAARL